MERQISAELRAWLGLEDDESVRVLSSGARTILLERSGGPSDTALPWDHDLVLTADVRSFPLADVLYQLHASARTGFLYFENGDHAKGVYLNRGEVVFATSNVAFDRLGECLLREGILTVEQHKEADRLYSPPDKFGKVLVDRNILTPRELWNGVKVQVEEIVRSLFSYSAGTVIFWEGEVRPDNVVRLSLPTRLLIAHGLQRRDELLKFMAWLEDPRVRLVPIPGAELSGTERDVYEAASTEARFPAVCRRAGIDSISGARTVYHLRLVGVLQVEREGGVDGRAAAAQQSEDDAVRECVMLYTKLLDELAMPIVAVDGSEAFRIRLERVVAEASQRFPEMLSDLKVGAGGSLDPEFLIQRALRYPGERVCEVRLALGELVSYLEFELMNHPRIDDPEQFLEGLADLRAES